MLTVIEGNIYISISMLKSKKEQVSRVNLKGNPLTLLKLSREYFLKGNKEDRSGKGQAFQTQDTARCQKSNSHMTSVVG